MRCRRPHVTVHATRTVYEFAGGGVNVELAFTTPTIPTDLDLLSKPITYLTWTVRSTDGKSHAASLYFDASAMLAVNTGDEVVNTARQKLAGIEALQTGSQQQPVLAKSGDDLRIDWGYFYLAAPAGPGLSSGISEHRAAVESFTAGRALSDSAYLRTPRAAGRDPVLAMAFSLGRVTPQPASRYVVLAYDDLFSIEYMHRKLRPWWRRRGSGPADLLQSAVADYETNISRCRRFDEQFAHDMENAGGPAYATLASLSFRQAFAAQKLVADADGTPLLFPKENFSNGCISTVDVIYPGAPILLYYNPQLLKAALTPVLNYAVSARWKFPFAPHDLGTYPLANGQVYGGGEKTAEDQMPVEESANLLLLAAGVAKADGNAGYAMKYWPALEKWAEYLREKGLDPENQLCTDDFAGHLAHNANLSLKAILALDAWASLSAKAGKAQEATEYRDLSKGFAQQWMRLAADGDHYRLTFDRPGSWSQKYNLVWDRLLGLNLFPPDVAEKEIAYYKTKQNRYGLPLDSRKTYTKLDWTVWTATLASHRNDFETLVAPLAVWINETSNRVPLTDWFDTVSGRQEGFQARSVVGGVFIRALAERGIGANEWRTLSACCCRASAHSPSSAS